MGRGQAPATPPRADSSWRPRPGPEDQSAEASSSAPAGAAALLARTRAAHHPARSATAPAATLTAATLSPARVDVVGVGGPRGWAAMVFAGQTAWPTGPLGRCTVPNASSWAGMFCGADGAATGVVGA